MPRVLIAVHQGFSVRYLLQTEIFSELRRQNADITILAMADPEGVRAQVADSGVVVDSIADSVSRSENNRWLQRILAYIRHYSFGGWVQTLEDHYQIARKDAEFDRQPVNTKITLTLLRLGILACRRSKLLRKALLAFEEWMFVPDAYVQLLDKHKPDLVVTSSVGTFPFDHFVMRAAKRKGIACSSVILSWDNTTTRGYPGASATQIVTWTEVMKQELIEYADVEPNKIEAGGVAQFDPYFAPDPGFDRAAFLRGIGGDPEKRTILFATKSPNGYAFNPNIARGLAGAIADGRLPKDCQVVVRVHPIHYRFVNGKLVYEAAIEALRAVAADYPFVVLNEPRIESKKINSAIASGEMQFVSRLLKSADVVVNIYSTLNIEGAIFDRPLVNVTYEGDQLLYPVEMHARLDIAIDDRATHNRRLLALGGVRCAATPGELVDAVIAYLQNPALDRDGRKRIVAQEVGPNAGKAGIAVARLLLKHAQETKGAANGGH